MSGTWLRPRISQKNADMVQTFHIILGFDGILMMRSVHFLRTFTFSRVRRRKCHREFDLYNHKDIKIMTPAFEVLAAFTTFQDVVVKTTGEGGSLMPWYEPEYAQARATCAGGRRFPYFPYLEFKPRDVLVRKGHLTDTAVFEEP